MGHKLCPHIILEGTRLTHKTDLAFALNEHPRIVGPRRYRYHSPIISAEWCAFTNFPWGRGLINFEPGEFQRAMETYATWLRLFELMPYYSWIIDRFHLSTRCHQRSVHGREPDFGWLEDGLSRLNFRVIHCWRDPATFPAARQARLQVSGNPGQYDDLGVFIREQEAMERLCRDSKLPVLRLDISHDDLNGAADRVADWLASTGGLTLD